METKRRELRRMVDDQFQKWELSAQPHHREGATWSTSLERDFIGNGIVDVPMTDSEVRGHLVRAAVGIPLYIYHRGR